MVEQRRNHFDIFCCRVSSILFSSENYFSLVSESPTSRDTNMMINGTSNGDLQSQQQQQQQHQIILGDSSGEDREIKAPKKRAETWAQDETRSLIGLRREMDNLFNTSKSNKHLWKQILSKMKDKGFDRSPTMCTDKWRNMLKEFKKAKHQDKATSGSSAKMSYYREIEDIFRERNKKVALYKTTTTPPSSAKVDSFMPFTDKGFEDTGISFASVEANGRPTLNLDRQLDHDGQSLAVVATDPVAANGVPPWNWRDTPGNGGDDGQPFVGRIISVKYGDYTRRVGIDGTAEAIKEAIRSVFRLRTRRAFWLEDEDQVVRSLDRDMPSGNYTLHVDEGIAVRVCHYDESDQLPVHQEEKIFYTEEDYRDFLARRGWTCLREFDAFRNIDMVRNIESIDELQPDVLYRGMR